MRIDRFEGPYEFLSNFYPIRISFEGITYITAEHAYQAAKTLDRSTRLVFLTVRTAAQAKNLGRSLQLRPDWDEVKLEVMESILREKFKGPIMRGRLIDTWPLELIEGNWWGDRFWGICNGEGENYLGKLLMKIREELRR